MSGVASEQVERFTTYGLGVDNRVELWEQHNAKALVGLECRTITASPLEATEINLRIDNLSLAHVSANAHIVERSARHIDTARTDGVVLYFTTYGESFFYYGDGVRALRPGSMLLCDVNQPFLRGFARGLQEFVVQVPQAVFGDIADDPRPRHPVMRSFGSGVGADVHTAALAQWVRATLSGAREPGAGATAIELLRAMFSRDAATSAAAHRRAAASYVDAHLRDITLSASRVARAVGVSERHLSRVFRDTGQSVARLIVDRRLALARRMLRAQSSAAMSVGEIALYCGFSSHAHFSRSFKDHLGMTPAEARRAAIDDDETNSGIR